MNTCTIKRLLLFLSVCAFQGLYSADNHHFYRASNFFYSVQEPRLEKPWLTTLDAYVSRGNSCNGRNSCGQKTNILNIYGLTNMQLLGSGLPGLDMTNPVDIALLNLTLLPARDNFGQFLFCGHFNISEANIIFSQNMQYGFFWQFHLPIRSLQISGVSYTDLSPRDDVFPNIDTPAWQTFLNLFPQFLDRYDINLGGAKNEGLGDINLLGGWSYTFEETSYLDFIDICLRTGVLIPTGKKANADNVFELPTGYNGHTGVPLMADASVGMWEWFTIGAHGGALIFMQACNTLRIKTDIAQNGWVKLPCIRAETRPGIIWDGVVYVKADHWVSGLSFTMGYTVAKKQEDHVEVCPDDCFDQCIVQSDTIFSPWTMHTLNFLAEYDFCNAMNGWGIRLGVFYNTIVGGKRIFDTGMPGFSTGIDVSWVF